MTFSLGNRPSSPVLSGYEFGFFFFSRTLTHVVPTHGNVYTNFTLLALQITIEADDFTQKQSWA